MVPNDAICTLYQSGFFKGIAKFMLHDLHPMTTCISKPESVLGVVMGLALKNKNLIRTSLTDMIGDGINIEYMNGIFGILLNDVSLER